MLEGLPDPTPLVSVVREYIIETLKRSVVVVFPFWVGVLVPFQNNSLPPETAMGGVERA